MKLSNGWMCRFVILTTVLLCGCSGRPDDQQNIVDGRELPEAEAAEPQSIVGTWEVVSMSAGDGPRRAYVGTRYTFSENGLQIDYNPDMTHTVHGALRFEIDPADRPNWIRVEGVGGCIAYWDEGTYSIRDKSLRIEFFGLSGVLQRIEPQPEVLPLTFDDAVRKVTTGLARSEEARADDDRIEGRWRRLDLYPEGVPEEVLLQDGKMEWLPSSKPPRPENHCPHPNPSYYILDASKEPKHFNFIDDSRDGAGGGVTYHAGIYKLEGDRLTICTAGPYRGRPSDFVRDDGQRRSVLSLQRVDDRRR